MWKHPKVARARRDSPTAADHGASGRGRIRPRNEAGTDGEGNDDDARGRIHGPARRPGVALEGLPLVDDIYLYESVEEGSYSFNAIFRRNDEIDMFSGMIPDQNTIDRILELGLEVLESLSGICAPPQGMPHTGVRPLRGLRGFLQLGRAIRMPSAPPRRTRADHTPSSWNGCGPSATAPTRCDKPLYRPTSSALFRLGLPWTELHPDCWTEEIQIR